MVGPVVCRALQLYYGERDFFLVLHGRSGGSLRVGSAKGRMDGRGGGVVSALPHGPCWVPRRVGLAGEVKSHRWAWADDWPSALQRFVSAEQHASSRMHD
jgi:hypothetical protein